MSSETSPRHGDELVLDLEVITLFVEDLPAARAFYTGVLNWPTVYQDEDSTVVRLGSVMLNLLRATQAPTLVEPVPVARLGAGARALFTIHVPDADAAVTELTDRGVPFLNGPIDRPWGRRTAAFADPAGNVWEIAADLPAS